MNVILITGRLGKNPEAKKDPEGNLCATVSVAEGGDRPNWFEVKCFGKTAEVLSDFGAKGRMVQESYEKNGKTYKVWRLIANRVEFLDSRKDGRGEADPPV